MGMDLYIMPWWRYWVGDFTSNVEAFVGAGKVATIRVGSTITIERSRAAVSRWRRWCARRSVANMTQHVRRANPGVTIRWNDDGEMVHSEQINRHGQDEALVAIAAIDHSDLWPQYREEIGNEPRRREFWRVFNSQKRTHDRWPHTRRVSFCSGIVLPCDFEHPVSVASRQMFYGTQHLYAVSGIRMLAELQEIARLLGVPESVITSQTPPCPMIHVFYLLQRTRAAGRMAIEHNLPMIFDC